MTQVDALRQRLAEARMSCALFDTPAYTRRFEHALEMMHQRHLDGEAPASFFVE